MAALAATACGGLAAPAQAADPAPAVRARVLGVSQVTLVPGSSDRALVSGTYRCKGGFSHLWVSAKQGGGDLAQEGSSAIANSWYQHTYDQVLRCDGENHTGTFGIEATKGRLKPGLAYVQFCIVTAASLADAQDGDVALASSMRYRKVVRL